MFTWLRIIKGLDKMELNDKITDMHLCLASPGKSLLFPGPTSITAEYDDLVKEITAYTDKIKKDDFMVTYGPYFFRGRRDRQAVDGDWLRLRRMASTPPIITELPTPMPTGVKKLVMSPHLLTGGLVYVIGAPASGKTTSCSAAVVSRLTEFGGYAYTVEDPPEMPLNGWHGKGYCSQTWVPGDSLADWQSAFRGVLRSQPSATPCILFVGEVRDAESAAALVRAASSGFLVLATGFGTDIPSSLDTLVRLASEGMELKSTLDSLSNVLRLVIHQRIVNGHLTARVLASANGRTAVAAKLREGRLTHLEGDIQYQDNQVMSGADIFMEHLKQAA